MGRVLVAQARVQRERIRQRRRVVRLVIEVMSFITSQTASIASPIPAAAASEYVSPNSGQAMSAVVGGTR